MKKFMILHYGFIKPTHEDMAGWDQWFESIADIQIERGHFPAGREITELGTKDLPFGRESITGYTMIEAESLDEAVSIAQDCPFVDSTRIYEVG
jgi:hypothetical protein